MTPLHSPHRQQGVSLIIVLVMMLLSSLLVIGGSRLTYMNEFLAGNDSDYQRAFEAAQILVRDAELDIQNAPGNLRPADRALSKIDNELILNLMDAALSAGATTCANGVCTNLGGATSGDPATSFWNDAAQLATFTSNNRGAFYGQWTGATANTANSNPIVSANNPRRAWYWIEILPYSGISAGWAQDCAPTQGAGKYFFRITAVALGRQGVPAAVQEVFVPKPQGDARRCPA
jgi:type IV pilus assembly protein PilX